VLEYPLCDTVVLIVEGDAENILLPTLARLIGRDLTEHGVSIVNVGGVGLGRYARIFQRSDDSEAKAGVGVRVACLTDFDVMPDCAKGLISKKLKTRSDLDESGLDERRIKLRERLDGQHVCSFVADWWTLEYDLAFCGLAEEVYIASKLARSERALTAEQVGTISDAASSDFRSIMANCEQEGSNPKHVSELVAVQVYRTIIDDRISKTVVAQYLAKHLETKKLGHDELRALLPKYITGAIDYVTRANVPASTTSAAVSASDA
jgi:putative ATP-dependent endonuclease of OLD family